MMDSNLIDLPHFIVIMHQIPNNQTVNFSSILVNAIKTGKITPHVASFLIITMTVTINI